MAKLNIRDQVSKRTGTEDSREVSLSIKDIPIGDISIKENVRKDYTDLAGLRDSIRQYGLLQPITVYQDGGGYAVKTGHRRYLAYLELYREEPDKFHSIRCILSNAHNVAVVQLVENVQRVDLSGRELYEALTALREQGFSHSQIAELMGKSEGYIKNLFMGVKELNNSPSLKELVSHINVTLPDIVGTKGIPDEQARIKLLQQRAEGKLTQADLCKETNRLRDKSPDKSAMSIAYSEKKRTVTITLPENALVGDLVQDLKKWLARKGFIAKS